METPCLGPWGDGTALCGKAALVTGGSRGVGLAIASQLAAAGMAIALLTRTAEDVHAAATTIAAAGGTVLALPAGRASWRPISPAPFSAPKRPGRISRVRVAGLLTFRLAWGSVAKPAKPRTAPPNSASWAWPNAWRLRVSRMASG